MTVMTLPTRRDEAFRYADLDALAGVWPVASEEWRIASGAESRSIVLAGPSAEARHLAITVEAGAACDLRVLAISPAYARLSLEVALMEQASFTLGGAIVGVGGQTQEIVTEVRHLEPGALSRQTIRAALGGQATGTYLGKVAVARGAQATDSAQSVRAMLLDRTAIANAKPELEIYADDVQCAHGCAIGELDANGLFYLQSRGLPPPQAKRLMLQAFVAEAFVGAGDEAELTERALAALEKVL